MSTCRSKGSEARPRTAQEDSSVQCQGLVEARRIDERNEKEKLQEEGEQGRQATEHGRWW